ncbi:MAG: hypothetical protein M3348_10125, partial [Acidobacteriota bacterium]|nr:hypothetical protein [Acidobacteriota bacterium]
MQHAFQIIEGAPKSGLPILVTANDVREVVQLLKKKREGITVVEASDAARKRLFDPRKMAAYELWGITSRSGDRIKLSRLGLEFARRLEPEAQLYRVLLDNTQPYRAVLEWIHRQRLELVTYADIAGYWRDRFPEALQGGEQTARGHVLSFLHLCHAAEIGTATAGRKGQPSRLRVDHEELAAHMESPARAASAQPFADAGQTAARRSARIGQSAAQGLRVLISAPKGAAVVGRVQDALQMADIDSEVVEREARGAGLIAERTCRAMRRCGAGVIVVGRADCDEVAAGEAVLGQSALIEIGAARVRYARRLVLLRDRG